MITLHHLTHKMKLTAVCMRAEGRESEVQSKVQLCKWRCGVDGTIGRVEGVGGTKGWSRRGE